MKESDKYLKIVEWSEEDKCYIGRCPGLFDGGIHGKNEKKVYNELCDAVCEWINIYKEDKEVLPEATNKDYSGKFIVRVGQELHKALVLRAMQHDESLNRFCKNVLKSVVLSHK